LLVIAALLGPTSALAASLSVEAANDIPGPVLVRAQGWDVACDLTFSERMEWVGNDNTYSSENLTIPGTTQTYRFTFINDQFTGGGQDSDRNLFLDFFTVDATTTQGENFDRTGGPDPQFPGCGMITIFGRMVTDCGNQSDYAEYGPDCGGAELICNDSVDNDTDGDTDCADGDCDGRNGCDVGTELTCDDAFDNDADGDTDCADADCDGVSGCEFGTELSCADAQDNDADGDTDCADADCAAHFTCLGLPAVPIWGLALAAGLLAWLGLRRVGSARRATR